MTRQTCEHHSQIAFQVERLTMRMDRIELAIVAVLVGMVVQLWLLWDLPGQIKKGEAHQVVPPAHAEAK